MVRYAALKNLYDVQKTIGTGGFAKVKLARHVLTGEKVAIKIMDKGCLGDDLPRVTMELEALKSLSHQNICQLYQVIDTDTHFFLVMEYCAGGELFDHIVQCNRLSEMESRLFFRQILSAVAFLHSKGYVHRDIKPENVLLDRDQSVKLIDFGLCARPSPSIDCQLETACGSPTYAAPELVRGDSYLGPAVDVWSMGVLLYALLCGSLPFESDKIDILYRQIVAGKYAIPEHLSAGSRQVLQAMLETNASKRITTEQLLSHPWVLVGYDEPVSYTSLYQELERDNFCVNMMVEYYRAGGNTMSAEEIWQQLAERQYDDHAATYQLLLAKKKQGRLCRYPSTSTLTRIQSLRRSPANNLKRTFVKMSTIQTQAAQHEKENNENSRMKTPLKPSPVRCVKKRRRSFYKDQTSSPIAKKRAAPLKLEGNVTPHKGPVKAELSTPVNTHPKEMSTPSPRLLDSIKKRMASFRRVMTPKRQTSEDRNLPNLLTVKEMSNVSTTSSGSPNHVKDELVKALTSRGIRCKCKGYSVRGKLETGGKVCKLSFELDVCLIPTVSNTSGSVVGIRRKRLKGDAWLYKRVVEEVLNMANLK